MTGLDNVCCLTLKRMVQGDTFPVSFCMEFSEYHLEMVKGHAVMRYCPFCGAKFPESTRGSLYHDASEDDLSEIKRLTHITSLEELCHSLGSPAESIETPMGTQHCFTKWNTVDLVVLQNKDGHLQYTAMPKARGCPGPED